MNRLKCEHCGQIYPMNVMYKASDRNFCKDCIEEVLQDPDNPLEGSVEPQVDPTVCATCGYDNGGNPLEHIAGLPVCQQCEGFLRNRPFPHWIKVSFAALIVLVVFSIFWHFRFIQAYRAMNSSYVFLANEDFEQAAVSMISAADFVPESEDLRLLAAYMEGRYFFWEDKPKKALEKLKLCVNRLPSEYGVDDIMLQAKMGVAFDTNDYDVFLACAKSFDEKYPNDFMSKATVASAYACKYAETGDENFQKQAFSTLEQARKTAADDPYFKAYENRIIHRLHTREIISPDEFSKRFPDGWEME